jgi:YVTN family beta-propeller protein
MVLLIITSALVVMLSNDAFAQSLHDRTLYEVVKQTSGLYQVAQINVGRDPNAIGIDGFRDRVYVANTLDGSVSVIDETTNTKIGQDIPVEKSPVAIGVGSEGTVYVANLGSDSISVIDETTNTKIGQDIPVGKSPVAIGVDGFTVYVANTLDGSVSVINGTTNTKIGQDIPVGKFPNAIGVGSEGTVYVANSLSDSISVINGTTNTKIGQDIPVGKSPWAIGVDGFRDMVYVANLGSDSISVINGTTNTKIGQDIPVKDPTAIGVDEYTDMVYVANSLSDSISVINGTTNTKIGQDIPVGKDPVAIGVDKDTHTVYVANSDSNGISVIDGIANKVVTGITFQVNPFNSGYIICDGLTSPSPVGQYIYVYFGAQCTSKPNEGFEFLSWEENLGGNSTQLISVSGSVSPWDSLAGYLGIKSSDKPEAKLIITKFGTFTANFKELPPAIPSEYWIPLYGIIISTIVGWSIPSIIGWARSKGDARKLNYYHKQIATLYRDGKLDENDIKPLNRLRSNILDAYSEGKINEKHYESLKDEISILYEKIFRNRIVSLGNDNPSNKKSAQEQLTQLRNEVKQAYSEGKINDKHYELLSRDILDLESKEKS